MMKRPTNVTSPRARVTIWLVMLASLCSGCATERIEYVRRPEYYRQAVAGGAPEKIILPDGTVRIYLYGDETSDLHRMASDEERFKSIEKDEDGNLTLRAILPIHVVSNTYACLRDQMYEPLWEQMVSEQTKLMMSEQGHGYEEFVDLFQRNRQNMTAFIRRVMVEMPRGGVRSEQLEGGVTRLRLSSQLAIQFYYKYFYIVNESVGPAIQLKLFAVR